ncbi:MAG: cellulase family glycosylhydrolase [Oscillospiraceae bacterium]|nr:cellulase family glycosylhydrolase [Oscillospiraceae bacterium]
MAFGTMGSAGVSAAPEKNGGMRDITTMELVREMGIGINLGNTMEACGDWIKDVDVQWGDGIMEVKDYETAWGSPIITQPMIQGMADEGFGVVRVPVAWSNMMSEDGNYTISPEYTARVQQIVDWVIDADMYCIINIHYDNGWVNKFPEDETGCMRRYEIMWTQIADAFKDYDDHLMFESQNEELGWESIWNPWSGNDTQKAQSYALCNRINQKFVDVIRSSGGNNPKRHLLISGYNTGFDRTCDPLFKMPDDPANRMAVSVHYYTPVGFAILEKDESWASARTTWGTNDDYNELNTNMDMMKTNYVDKGIPVIIGEYGCPTVTKDKDSVRKFLSSVCKAAYERNMCPVLWATPQASEYPDDTINGHYNRTTCQLSDRELSKAFHEITGFDPSAKPTEPPTEETTEATEPETEEPTVEPTEEPTEPQQRRGDVNKDGAVNVLDVVTLQRWLLGVDTACDGEAADLDGSGEVDIFDLGLLKQIVLHS